MTGSGSSAVAAVKSGRKTGSLSGAAESKVEPTELVTLPAKVITVT